MEEHTFVTVKGLRVKIKMSYHIIINALATALRSCMHADMWALTLALTHANYY